jgi:peptide/nickel transport system ATP-binding protein
MVYQDPGTALNPAMTVGVQVGEVRRQHFGERAEASRRRVLESFETVGLDAAARIYDSYPHQLSGGQRQRVMIAMALAGEPELLLMDEPTTALDVIVQARILDLVRELKSRIGAAILFVTHDLGAVAGIADRIGVLYAGDLMELGPAEAVLRDPNNPYTRGLLAAIPRVAARTPLSGIPGTTSKAPGRFAHCVFAGRCGLTAEICRRERPALVPADPPGRLSRCHFARDPARLALWPPPAPREAAAAPAGAAAPLLRVADLSIDERRGGFLGRVGGSVVHAVKDVSLQLGRERVLAIVGESGSGKSTLARAILRLEKRRAGRVLFADEDVFALGADALRRFRRSVQIVFQNPTSSLNPRKQVAELVGRPLRLGGADRAETARRTRAMLEAVGLGAEFMTRYPHELSGGEKQRVALARAFGTGPALVILDEPTTALDVSVQAAVLRLLEELKRTLGCTYLLITHDLAVVRHIADDVVVMRAGEVCEAGPAEALFSRPRHPYTKALLDAAPRL